MGMGNERRMWFRMERFDFGNSSFLFLLYSPNTPKLVPPIPFIYLDPPKQGGDSGAYSF